MTVSTNSIICTPEFQVIIEQMMEITSRQYKQLHIKELIIDRYIKQQARMKPKINKYIEKQK